MADDGSRDEGGPHQNLAVGSVLLRPHNFVATTMMVTMLAKICAIAPNKAT